MLLSFVVEHAATRAAAMATVMKLQALRRKRAGNGISDLSPDGSECRFQMTPWKRRILVWRTSFFTCAEIVYDRTNYLVNVSKVLPQA
jgi:hypothetical protein